MWDALNSLASWGTLILKGGAHFISKLGFKPIRYFIDSHFRPKVVPEPGSVLYCDLWYLVEHSGIYAGDGQIANIEVTDVAEGQVRLSDGADFTSKSKLGKRIYVSCNGYGAVGNDEVATGAVGHLGEKSFYGLVIKNCHQFSSKCVHYAQENTGVELGSKLWWHVKDMLPAIGEWEPTIRQLKQDAHDKLGATKWLLWDWNQQAEQEPEPDWAANEDFFKSQPLTPEFVTILREQLLDTKDYEAEIADEPIPDDVRRKLRRFGRTLEDVSELSGKVKGLLGTYSDVPLSYNDIQACGADFAAMAKQLENNQTIRDLAKKMGRTYLHEEVKKRTKVPQANRSEVHGVELGADLLRMLPSELANLEDDTLEVLFYSRLLENRLQCYQLKGQSMVDQDETDTQSQRTGPVVACLDTSASMSGEPLIKAKALLFAIADLLRREQRSLHVLLFGSSGEIWEYSLVNGKEFAGLLSFLRQGFGGGTDFESPLKRAVEIIGEESDYLKADILMISDGDADLSDEVTDYLAKQKQQLSCCVYSVLCNGKRVADRFSDEVVVL